MIVVMFPPDGGSAHQMKRKRDAVWRGMNPETRATYGREYMDAICDAFESTLPQYPSDLSPVVRALRSGLLSKRPREKYAVGAGVGTFLTFYPLLPVKIADCVSMAMGLTDREKKPAALQGQ